MKNNRQPAYPPLFSSPDYYSRRSLQFQVGAVSKSVIKTTALTHNDGITLLYFKSGEGKIIVNARDYSVRQGYLMTLGSYHYFRLQPTQGPLEFTECILSYETFLYMAANPYYELSELNLSLIPLTAHLDGEMRARTEDLVEQLVSESSKSRQKNGELPFFLTMRLMGIMQKTFNRHIWQGPEPAE